MKFYQFITAVLLYDGKSRLLVIKIPHNQTRMVQASLTLLSQVKGIPAIASVISVNGSLRTLKVAAIEEMNRIFSNELTHGIYENNKQHRKAINSLKERIGKILSM